MSAAGFDCYGSYCHEECELRHLDEIETSIRRRNSAVPSVHPSNHSNLIICAAPERSGSTWLYNAIRLLYRDCGMICDSYWIHALRKDAIEARLREAERVGGIVLVKTHEWNESYSDWLVQTFRPTIILTHRDLHGVVKSYRRVGWSDNLPANYVADHLKWKDICSLDLKYEDIVSNGLAQLQKLAQHLFGTNVCSARQDVIECVYFQLLDLDRPSGGGAHIGGGAVHQVTKIWPHHVSDETRKVISHLTLAKSKDERGSEDKKMGYRFKDNTSNHNEEEIDELALKYPTYMTGYGYVKAT